MRLQTRSHAAVEAAAATRDRHGNAVRHRIHARDEVRAGLARVIGMFTLQRRGLVIRQFLVRAVGFVARRRHYGADEGTSPRGLEQRPRPADVRVERRHGVPIGDADDGLRGEVEDRIDFILAQRAFHEMLIAHVAADDIHARERVGREECAARHPVAHERRDVGAFIEQPPDEPAAEQAGGAGDQDGPVTPVRCRFLLAHFHFFHGGAPPAQSDSSRRRSRSVSIGCQKPSWRNACSSPSLARRSSGSRSQSVSSASM